MSIFDRFARRGPGSYRDVVFELADNAEEDREEYPEDAEAIESFAFRLEEECRERYARKDAGGPVDAAARFFVSRDGMRALACLLPPAGGAEADCERFFSDAEAAGVRFGLDMERARRYVDGRLYLHIFPLAAGLAPQHGEPGSLERLFQRREPARLEAFDGAVDFSDRYFAQPVRRGGAICRIRPPVPGTPGRDVSGREIPCREEPAVGAPRGENTELSADGTSLVASADGLVYVSGGLWCVRPVKLVDGDLNAFDGVLRVQGGLYVAGSVSGGARVEAGGDVLIAGEVRNAFVASSGGSVRIQQGVHGAGEKSTVVRAARQIQACVIERASAETGGDLIAESVVDSRLNVGRALYVVGERGLILDSYVLCARHVDCTRLGNASARRSEIVVGFSPETAEAMEKLRQELRGVQETKDLLWKNVAGLRRAGFKLTDEQKELLPRLVEQRNLYEEKETKLREQIRELRASAPTSDGGYVRCRELYPAAVIQIGEHRMEVSTREQDCNFRVVGGSLVIR